MSSVEKVIGEVKAQYVDLKNITKDADINRINNIDTQFLINDLLYLEILLCEIRDKTISYSSFRKKLIAKINNPVQKIN